MSVSLIKKILKHLPAQQPAASTGVTMHEIVSHLVGHTIDEVERELVLCTLTQCHGYRTRSAAVLGISIRCMRKKIHEYVERGIAVPESRLSFTHIVHH